MLQIVNQRLADHLHEWQKDFLAAFLCADANAGMLPIEIIQQQVSGRNAPDAVSHHQNHERVISCPFRCLFGNRIEDLLQGGVCQSLGQGRMSVTPDWMNQT